MFDVEQALDAAGCLERDCDAVDRVGRQRDDAAGAEHVDGRRPTCLVICNHLGSHAEATIARSAVSAACRSPDSSDSRATARRAAAGDARTSASIIRATPSSASGGAT